jgi:replicative DNA helicase
MSNLIDPAAERAVLAAVCTYGGDAYADVSDLVTTRSFGIDSNQTIWRCLEHLFSENPKAVVDYPTLMSAAAALGVSHLLDGSGEQAHLRAVMNFPVLLANARKMAGVLKKLEFIRQSRATVQGVLDDIDTMTGAEPIDNIVARIETPVLDNTALLTQSGGSTPVPVGNGVRDFVAGLAAFQRPSVGIPSGYREFDRGIGGGFRPGTVSCIGARPKTGKTLLAMNIGVRVASGAGYDWPTHNPLAQVPVLNLDTEMVKEDQWTRMVAMVSGVSIDDIETGRFSRDPMKAKAIKDAIDKLESIPYDFLSIAGQPFDETQAVMRRWVTNRVRLNDDGSARPCLIIFDYLKLMDSEAMTAGKMAEFQVLGFMMTQLHNFAVRYRVPILTFVQLNRDGINLEDTSAVSQSDRIIWLCSNFSIYKPKSDEEMAEQAGAKVKYNRKLIQVVARHGAGLGYGDYVNVQSLGAVARIVEGPTRDQLSKGGGPAAPAQVGTFVTDPGVQPGVDFAAAA